MECGIHRNAALIQPKGADFHQPPPSQGPSTVFDHDSLNIGAVGPKNTVSDLVERNETIFALQEGQNGDLDGA